MIESHDHRLKRLKMRSMRRGIREMDLILTAWADANLHTLNDAELDQYDAMLNENDQDLYQWVTGQVDPPTELSALIGQIAQTFQK